MLGKQNGQGRSVLPLMTPRRAADPAVEWPTEAFGQISEAQIGRFVRTARWKYLLRRRMLMHDTPKNADAPDLGLKSVAGAGTGLTRRRQ